MTAKIRTLHDAVGEHTMVPPTARVQYRQRLRTILAMGSRSMVHFAGASLAALIMLIAAPARGVIERPYPLATAVADADVIIVAKVERVDTDRRAAVLLTSETIKGQAAPARLPLLLTGESAEQSNQVIERLAPGRSVIVFITDTGEKSLTLIFSEGTWLQATGKAEGDVLRLAFTHMEPYLRRTFKGTTDELRTALVDAIAGRADLPAVDATVAPGLGEALVKVDAPAPAATEPATTEPATSTPAPGNSATSAAPATGGAGSTWSIVVAAAIVAVVVVFIVMAKTKRSAT